MRIVPPRPGALGSDRPVTADGCVRVTVTDCPAGRSILLSDLSYIPRPSRPIAYADGQGIKQNRYSFVQVRRGFCRRTKRARA